MILITDILPDSPAAKQLLPEDQLVSVNGHSIRDVLDYQFYTAEKALELTVSRRGVLHTYTIHKDQYEDLGLQFESYLMDEKQRCRNQCVFCFIDQLPKGMRETLYFKDDDDRLSFLQGNYITLTNLTQEEINRIIAMKLNVNVSVHTTNPELRCRMMNNRFAGKALDWLRQLAEGGIHMNCQLVLCPGLNDGAELERSLHDLSQLMPQIDSIAVVPVGLTKYRQGLAALTPFNRESAEAVLTSIKTFQEKMLKAHGTRLAYAADEFYLLAERAVPPAETYEGYPQYENGVGMLRSLTDEFLDALEEAEAPEGQWVYSLACGYAAADTMQALSHRLSERFPNITLQVYPIRNDFFGETITVTGLLTGQDLLAQLKGQSLGSGLLLSDCMLRQNTETLLDDMTVSHLSEALSIPIHITTNDGYSLLEAILTRP